MEQIGEDRTGLATKTNQCLLVLFGALVINTSETVLGGVNFYASFLLLRSRLRFNDISILTAVKFKIGNSLQLNC